MRSGRIYARGALDDKGPALAAYFALKAVRDSGLPLVKKIQFIIGTDEESGWLCVKHYGEKETFPEIGFSPDSEFPIIHAEKGQVNPTLKLQIPPEPNPLNGIASHGAFPYNGKNAGTLLAVFLNSYPNWTARSKAFLGFAADILHQDHYGEQFGVACEDEITGKLTLNPGIFNYAAEGDAEVKITLRYPATASQKQLVERVHSQAERFGWIVSELRTLNAHHVPKDHPAIKTLQRVYREQTGQEAELLFSGGATYARCMKYGVAFGPLFPGREDTAHQKDEYMPLDDLVKLIGIYAQAIYELCKET